MRSDDRRSAEWRPVGGSSSRPRHHGRAQLRREGETGIGLWRGGGTCRLKGRRQETYDVIEISLIIDAGKPGLIGGARMRECDRSNDQKGQQHSAQATDTRGVQAIENGHSRLVRSRSVLVGRRHYGVGKVGCQDESYRLMIWICLVVQGMYRPLHCGFDRRGGRSCTNPTHFQDVYLLGGISLDRGRGTRPVSGTLTFPSLGEPGYRWRQRRLNHTHQGRRAVHPQLRTLNPRWIRRHSVSTNPERAGATLGTAIPGRQGGQLGKRPNLRIGRPCPSPMVCGYCSGERAGRMSLEPSGSLPTECSVPTATVPKRIEVERLHAGPAWHC